MLTLTRAVTHRLDPSAEDDIKNRCRIDATKNGKSRTVTITPRIRDDIKAHLAQHAAKSPEALLFTLAVAASTWVIGYSTRTYSIMRPKR